MLAVSLDLGGTRLAIGVPDTPDKRDPPDNPHKHFGLEHLGIRTDDAESLLKRAVAEGATIMENDGPPEMGQPTLRGQGPKGGTTSQRSGPAILQAVLICELECKKADTEVG